MAQHNIFLLIAGLLAACTLCQWGAWRVKLPAIIFLLLTGILVGPVLHLLHPEQLMGQFFFPFVSLSVAVILFEGSLTLRFRDILGFEKVIRNMLSFGMIVTWLITAVAAHYLIDLSWNIALLLGAVTVVTGPTVITPILRTVRPTPAVSNILRWEGIVIDPIGATLAVLVYEFIIAEQGQDAWGRTLFTFAKLLSVGTLLGAAIGQLWGQALRLHWFPDFLRNVATLSLVIVAYIIADTVQPESGLVTVTVMGLWLANMRDVEIEDILNFKESISLLLISLLFIMLAARIDLQSLLDLGWRAGLLFLAVQFLARPLNIMVSSLQSKLTWPERHILAWIAPRGIVAAAISSLFAVQLDKAGHVDAQLLSPLTFFVIITTVLLQSTTARPIARWLGVIEPEPKGFLIIGANHVARAMARALVNNGVQVLLADTVRNNISQARLEGLRTYYGNPFSEHADRHLTLTGIGRILALSPHETVNMAATMYYRMEFGPENVYMVRSKPQGQQPDRVRLAIHRRPLSLFGGKVTFSYLASVLSRGGGIHTTNLTKQFDFARFLQSHDHEVVPLFALEPKGDVRVFCGEQQTEPKAGWSVIYLQPHAKIKRGRKESR